MARANKKPRKTFVPHKNKTPGKPKTKEAPIVCNDIEKLSFAKFIKCMVHNNIPVLREAGEPTGHQLFHAWITILSSYYTLIKSKDQLKYIRMVAKMESYNLKITVVTALCEALRIWYEPKLVSALKKWGYKMSYSEETLFADLDRTLIELSNDNFKLVKLRAEYDRDHANKKKKGEAPTKEYYMKILYAIEKHRQQRYPPDSITVYEFGMWYNELIEYNEMIKEQTEKNTYRRPKKDFKNGK